MSAEAMILASLDEMAKSQPDLSPIDFVILGIAGHQGKVLLSYLRTAKYLGSMTAIEASLRRLERHGFLVRTEEEVPRTTQYPSSDTRAFKRIVVYLRTSKPIIPPVFRL